MKPYILMVAWLIPGQPPYSCQVTFFAEKACLAARDAVLADGRRVKAHQDQVQMDAAKATGVGASPLPSQQTISRCFGRLRGHRLRLSARPRHLRSAPATPYSDSTLAAKALSSLSAWRLMTLSANKMARTWLPRGAPMTLPGIELAQPGYETRSFRSCQIVPTTQACAVASIVESRHHQSAGIPTRSDKP